MTTNINLRLALLVLFISCIVPQGPALANDETHVLDRPADYIKTVFHVGLWVEDVEEMLGFLREIMEFNIVSRTQRQSGGERVILSDSRGQLIELLSDEGNVQAHPDFPLHPRGRTAGVAHIAIWADDVAALKNRLSALGYEVLAQVPEDYADGYVSTEGRMYRLLFIKGPGAMTFELFEVKK